MLSQRKYSGKNDKSHPQDLCEKCKELGYNCKDYDQQADSRERGGGGGGGGGEQMDSVGECITN